MTITLSILWAIVLLIVLICIAAPLVFGWVFDEIFPSKEQEEERARRDVEEMLKRATEETAKRPRVRAGTPL
jgi:hypothetical protein